MTAFADYVRRTDDWFVVRHSGGEAAALLVECRAHDGGDPPASFSVIFRTAPELPAEQGTYELRAAGLEPEQIFLVPIGAVSDDPRFATVFEAVFNTSGMALGGTRNE